MTTWTVLFTSSTSWSQVQNTSEGYFETEDNLDLLATETGLLFQQEGGVVIAPDDWQDVPATSTTTWTQQ